MSLRRKVQLIAAAAIVGFATVFYVTSEFVLLRRFAELEQQAVRRNVEQASSMLNDELSYLNATAYDWAVWDDSYNFVHDLNQQYVDVNLVETTFIKLRLNLMLYVNAAGETVFVKAFDLLAEEEVPVSLSLQEHISANPSLLYHRDTESHTTGIILLAEGPMLVASRPILSSEGKGPVIGTLLMARYLNAAEVNRIGRTAHLSVGMHRLDDLYLPADLQSARSELEIGKGIFVQPLGDNVVAGYTLLKDISGNPALVLKVEEPRDIYRHGMGSTRYFILSLTLFGLMGGAIALFLLEKLVLSRVTKLEAGVSSVGADGNTSVRVSVEGNDELSSLATSINGMLERIEKSRASLRDSEERYRLLVNNANEAIIVIQDLMVIYANPKAARLSGYSLDQPLSFTNLVHPDDRELALQRHLQRIKGEKVPDVYPIRIVDSKGNIGWVEISAVSISWRGKPANLVFLNDITEHRQAEEALRQNEERFRVAAKSTNDLIWEWNVKDSTLLWFGDIDGILGYQPGEFPRTLEAWEKTVHPDDHDWVMEALQRGVDGVEPYDVKYRVLRNDGSVRHWTDRGTATTLDENGHAQIMVGACSDITARELAMETLQKSEERYRTVLEEMADNYFEVDLAGNMMFANDATCRTLGYSADELKGMKYRTFIAEEHREALYRSFNTVYQTGKMLKGVSYDIVRKDGSRGTGDFAVSPRRNEKGEIIGFRGIGRDITERKQAEEALKKSEEKYRTVLEEMEEGYYEQDLAGNFTFVNDSITRLLGYSRQELIGMNYLFYVPEEDRETLFGEWNRVYQSGEPMKWRRLECVRKDGTRLMGENSLMPLRDAQGNTVGFRGIIRDITERVQMEAERKDLEFKAQMASRLATVGEMAAGVAHEINNPLTAVIGYAQFVMQEDLPQNVKKDMELINEGAQRVAGIVKRLLAFARQTKPQRDFVNINDVINITLNFRAYHLNTSNIKVTTKLDPDLPITVADGGQLQQVFLNLIINAGTEMKLAHGKGKLQIKTEKVEDNIRISFKDDGPGITKENLEKIFNPFFTTRQVGEGTGLGLSICYGIVTEHGGKIWAESKPGKGATFIVELPIVTEPEQLPLAEASAEETHKVAKARILVVDDEVTVRDLLKRTLEEEGHKVECVDNAADALELVQKKRYSLILLDVKMPGMSGPELYRRMEKITKSLPRRVVFVTGDVIGTGTQEFLKKTRARYIAKPFDVAQIKKEINSILAEGA